VEKKGATYLLEAFAEFCMSNTEAHLTMVGDGSLGKELERQVTNANLTDRVTFTGSVSSAEVAGYLHAADCLVVPSIIDSRGETEGTPVVILEAFGAGVPVIASSVSGIPDVVVDDECGFVVPPCDVNALADAMQKMADETTHARLADGARAAAPQYGWDVLGRRYQQIYDDLIGKPRPEILANELREGLRAHPLDD